MKVQLGKHSIFSNNYIRGANFANVLPDFIQGFYLMNHLTDISDIKIIKSDIRSHFAGVTWLHCDISDFKDICWFTSARSSTERAIQCYNLCAKYVPWSAKRYTVMIYNILECNMAMIHLDSLEFVRGVMTYASWISNSVYGDNVDNNIKNNGYLIFVDVFENVSEKLTVCNLNIEYQLPTVVNRKAIIHIIELLLIFDIANIVWEYFVSKCNNRHGSIKCITEFDDIDDNSDSKCPGCSTNNTNLKPFLCTLTHG